MTSTEQLHCKKQWSRPSRRARMDMTKLFKILSAVQWVKSGWFVCTTLNTRTVSQQSYQACESKHKRNAFHTHSKILKLLTVGGTLWTPKSHSGSRRNWIYRTTVHGNLWNTNISSLYWKVWDVNCWRLKEYPPTPWNHPSRFALFFPFDSCHSWVELEKSTVPCSSGITTKQKT